MIFHLLLLYTGKRKRDGTSELVQYLERADERFLQHSREMDDGLRQDMRENTKSLLGLMGRMVAVMEAQVPKRWVFLLLYHFYLKTVQSSFLTAL